MRETTLEMARAWSQLSNQQAWEAPMRDYTQFTQKEQYQIKAADSTRQCSRL